MFSTSLVKGLLVRFSAAFIAASSLLACSNYTTAPLCDEKNSVMPKGFAGNYTVSMQKEDFSIQTIDIQIVPSKAKATFLKYSKDGEAQESSICKVNGGLISEGFNEDLGAYEQQRLHISEAGLTFLPLMFDLSLLEGAGIAAKTIELPSGARAIFGSKASQWLESTATQALRFLGDEAMVGLMIDNSKTDSSALLNYSATAPIGITLLRN